MHLHTRNLADLNVPVHASGCFSGADGRVWWSRRSLVFVRAQHSILFVCLIVLGIPYLVYLMCLGVNVDQAVDLPETENNDRTGNLCLCAEANS